MAPRIKKFEAPELRKSIIHDKLEKGLNVYLWTDGGLIIETAPGELIDLTPAQTADLFVFFSAPRVKTRMLDVLRAKLWKAGGACREIIRIIDKTPPFKADQPTAQ
jgi:hypothetical protein